MNRVVGRTSSLSLGVAIVVPLLWCALAAGSSGHLIDTTAALVLVLLVAVVATVGTRVTGLTCAVSGAAWFDFFLTEPRHSFAIDSADDVEVAVVLVLVGLLVTEVVRWGQRQQSVADDRAAYLEDVMLAAESAAAGSAAPTASGVTSAIAAVLGADAARFVPGASAAAFAAAIESDGTVTTRRGHLDVDRSGLPTIGETAIPVRHHGTQLGQVAVASVSTVARPDLERRRVAVLLATQLGAELSRATR